jgi:molecular chaperone GrpE (heat shock protein)
VRRRRKAAVPGADTTLEELAQDMLDLLERVSAVQDQQTQLDAGLERINQAIQDASSEQRRVLGRLHRDLLGDWKAAAAHSVFRAVAPALDSLSAMREALDPKPDERVRMQADAVVVTLGNLLLSLGYEVFSATVGEEFAPDRMESLGYADGAPGIVLACVRPGYTANGTVVRPAGVLIADPGPSRAPTEEGNRT